MWTELNNLSLILIFADDAIRMLSGLIRPQISTNRINVIAQSIPGITPAIKQCPIDTPARFPYIIMVMLGGIRMPSVPPAEMLPYVMVFE